MKTLRVVSVSGGKDSTATALLALEQYPADEVRLVFADTGNEHEVTLDYVHNYMPAALGVPVHTVRSSFDDEIAGKRMFIARDVRTTRGLDGKRLRWNNAGKRRALAALVPTGNPFLDLCLWKGRFPSRRAQFCTQYLKTIPLIEWQMELIEQGYLVESWQGIRRDESRNRSDALEREDRGGGLSIRRPIVDWTAQQTVDYVRSHGLILNPLYRQGMSRVGCMPCINANKDELLEISRRFPGHIDRIEYWESVVKDASKRNGSTFFSGQAVNRGLSTREAVAASNIRTMVEWSQTSRGGTQYDFFRVDDHESPACASAYGLCE